ncbi:Uncharacterized protein Adt_41795 [Abeliophyllum distichum]|uniref:Uncharacterized protein n=1 Tax=Abeliophyllum distichum TaxID=126358 RepID=A0ABD1PQN7_9LAMI
MVIPNFEKLDFPKFKLVVDGGEDELCPSAFECQKGKAVVKEEGKLCVRCQKEVGKVIEKVEAYRHKTHPINTIVCQPFRGQIRPFYGRQYGSFQGVKTFRPQLHCPNVWHSYNPKVGRVIPFNKMIRTQQRGFQRNYGQMMRQQQGMEHLRTTMRYGTMSPVMANNYLLANEFKNKEHDDEITEENEEVACMLECREGTPARNQFTHNNDEEEDDGIINKDEDIDLEVERRALAKSDDDMIPTEVILTSFNGMTTSAKGVMPLDITVESATRTTVFFMIDGSTSYDVLLWRDWIHGNRCIPSSLH